MSDLRHMQGNTLVVAVAVVVAEHGYAATTITQLTRRAGTSP